MLDDDSFKGIDVALFSAGGSLSKRFVPAVMAAGAVMVDNSSAFRMVPGVPLVVPEINPQALKEVRGRQCRRCACVVRKTPTAD